MSLGKYIDIKIEDDDLATDVDGLPLFVSDQDSIIQDIKHMIRESGYLISLVAERSPESRQMWIQNIILLIEDDERIIPGSVQMYPATTGDATEGRWTIEADTYEYGTFNLEAVS